LLALLLPHERDELRDAENRVKALKAILRRYQALR
jgi:hypothetical protein